jgi:LPS O-antigen subunit length determinant protein (WzzB/FepE family)
MNDVAAPAPPAPPTLTTEVAKLWRHRLWVIVGTAVTVVGAAIWAFITPNEYLATGALLPPNFDDIKSLNFYKGAYKGMGAADVEDLERVSAALQSDTAFKLVVRHFNLIEHYRLDPTADPNTLEKKLRAKYKDKVSIGLSANSVVEIKVYDEDSKRAARMVNYFIAYADSFVESVARRKEALAAARQSLERWQGERKRLVDTLAQLRVQHRLYHFDYLSEEVSRLLLPYINRPEFHAHYDKLRSAEHLQEHYENQIAELTAEVIFREENLRAYPSLVTVMAWGVPAYAKDRPKRSIYLLLGFIFGFVGSSLVVIVWKNREE